MELWHQIASTACLPFLIKPINLIQYSLAQLMNTVNGIIGACILSVARKCHRKGGHTVTSGSGLSTPQLVIPPAEFEEEVVDRLLRFSEGRLVAVIPTPAVALALAIILLLAELLPRVLIMTHCGMRSSGYLRD